MPRSGSTEDVALLTRFAWPSVGGTQQLVRSLALELTHLGQGVRVIAHRIDDRDSVVGRFDHIELWPSFADPDSGVVTEQLRLRRSEMMRLSPPFWLPRRIARLSRRYPAIVDSQERRFREITGDAFQRQIRGAGIVHRFGGQRMAGSAVTAARAMGVPVVITPLSHQGMAGDDPISAQAYRDADLVVATSATDAAIYESLGVKAGALSVCPLPTAEPVRGGGEALRQRRGIEGPIVLFLGARRDYKGVPELLGAADTLTHSHPDAKIAFVGPGDPLPSGSPSNALDVGPVDPIERDAWLEASDIVCLPSSGESFGLAVSEAWSMGKPVITSDLPVLRERVTSVGGGIAVAKDPHQLADAMGSLLSDPALGSRLGAAGYEHWVRTGSPRRYAQWHIESYARLRSG